MNKTSIIILTYNNFLYTKECISSIRKYTNKNTYEIIVIDNNSSDETISWLKKQKDLKVIYNKENIGFPKGVNLGIKIAQKENDILLLNNDTIVTCNWLTNLKKCLYSDSSIGAVGPVCNQDENKQGSLLNYSNILEMQQKAIKHNISNADKWEEKVFIIGFCLLIKRKVFDKIKYLDEKYSPGYIEDNDLSIRISNLGYRLILCHDVFIHHYLGTAFRKDLNKFYLILNKNRKYFKRKWHFETVEFDRLKNASLVFIENYKTILDYNCGIGVLMLYLKYRYNSIIDGLEKDYNKRIISSKFGNVYKNLNETDKYDCILIGDELEQVNNPMLFLKHLKKHLNYNGVLIGEIHNFSSIHNLNYLLHDISYEVFKNEKNIFTLNDLKKLLILCGYQDIMIYSWYENKNLNEEKLLNLFNLDFLNYSYYTFKAIKKEN